MGAFCHQPRLAAFRMSETSLKTTKLLNNNTAVQQTGASPSEFVRAFQAFHLVVVPWA
jgi:hypothetical protein